jgi:murein DD-endopeptidase MepM/ murein hydrolase activator NlpD
MTRLSAFLVLLTSIAPEPQTQLQQPQIVPPVVNVPKLRPFADVPVIWPVKGQINSGFGQRWDPFTKHMGFHTGLDISGKTGQPVYAPADGTVTWAKRMREYGNLLILEHKNGITTWYGHLSSFEVNVGDSVMRGDIIGKIGSTGMATGAHLHLEIRQNDVPIDPTKYILDTITASIEKEQE